MNTLAIQKHFQKNLDCYYLALILLTVAYSLPHAVLTIVLLNKGLTLSEIMFVQAVYSFAVLISEYPSGLVADLYSKKIIFIISKFFLMGMFVLVMLMHSFLMMALAWFLYGISSALDSGTIDVELINNLKVLHHGINNFVKNSNRISFGSLLIGSTIGSFAYYRFGIHFYWISILLTVFSIGVISVCFKELEEHKKYPKPLKQMLLEGISGLKEIDHKETLKLMMLLTFVGQFFFQAHFQMWQAIFLIKGFGKHYFFMVYVIFQLVSILAYSLDLTNLKLKNVKWFGFLLIPSLIVFLGLIKITDGILFSIFYVIWVFIFTVFDYLSNYLFSKYVSKQRISSLTSLKSSCGRIAALLAMLECGVFLKYLSVTNTVMINFGFSAIISIYIVYRYVAYRKTTDLD